LVVLYWSLASFVAGSVGEAVNGAYADLGLAMEKIEPEARRFCGGLELTVNGNGC